MISKEEYKQKQNYLSEVKTDKSYYAIFLKKLDLQTFKSRLLMDANSKFNILINKFLLAWSYRINDKAYVNRRRTLRSNSSSSY